MWDKKGIGTWWCEVCAYIGNDCKDASHFRAGPNYKSCFLVAGKFWGYHFWDHVTTNFGTNTAIVLGATPIHRKQQEIPVLSKPHQEEIKFGVCYRTGNDLGHSLAIGDQFSGN